MSTNAYLISRTSNGMHIAARLQLDGYPEHVLPILRAHYIEPESVESLISLGEIRCLDAKSGDAQTYANAQPPLTAHRLDLLVSAAIQRVVSHLYLFDGTTWHHSSVAGRQQFAPTAAR